MVDHEGPDPDRGRQPPLLEPGLYDDRSVILDRTIADLVEGPGGELASSPAALKTPRPSDARLIGYGRAVAQPSTTRVQARRTHCGFEGDAMHRQGRAWWASGAGSIRCRCGQTDLDQC